MSDIKKILVAIAFSKYSEAEFEYSAKLASDLDAQLVVFNVINARDVKAISSIESMGYQIDTDEYIKGIEKERTSLLKEMMEAVSFSEEKMKVLFRVGHPYEELMKVIQEENIDLLIMGPKGRTDLEHALVGSVAEKVFRHSPVPVVFYRKRKA